MSPASFRLTLFLALACFYSYSPAAITDDDTPTGLAVPSASAAQAPPDFTLTLIPGRQQAAGLKTEPLKAAEWSPETRAYATVLDLQALFEQRARFRAALSDVNIAESAQRVAGKNLERLSHLHREAIIPARELFQAEAQHAADLARLEAARNRLREIRETALQQWGEALFRQTIASESALFQALLTRKQGLILLTATSADTPPEHARLGLPGRPDTARAARWLSAAPRIDTGAQGSTWFYLVEAPEWRAGQHLEAWLAMDGEMAHGVAIPLAAVLWHEGQPWVYVKIGADRFNRRSLGSHQRRGEVFLVSTGYTAGEEVVVGGAQTLLSEELRRFIPDEDED